MFSQGGAAPAFFDHAADYKDALTPVLAGKLGMAYTSATQLLEQEKITQADFDATAPGSQTAPQWWAKDKGVWKPKSKWTINMCDFVNKSGSNVSARWASEEGKGFSLSPSVLLELSHRTSARPLAGSHAPL